MGARFMMMKVAATMPKADLIVKFRAVQEQDRHDNGHSYSGGFGMTTGLTFSHRSFADEREARTFLENTCQKGEEAIAVRVGDYWLIGAWCAS